MCCFYKDLFYFLSRLINLDGRNALAALVDHTISDHSCTQQGSSLLAALAREGGWRYGSPAGTIQRASGFANGEE